LRRRVCGMYFVLAMFNTGGGIWAFTGSLNDRFNHPGIIIIGVFIDAWLASFVIYRVKRYDDPEVVPVER
jgi:nickel/cobalt transporter (NiCoT) family protein